MICGWWSFLSTRTSRYALLRSAACSCVLSIILMATWKTRKRALRHCCNVIKAIFIPSMVKNPDVFILKRGKRHCTDFDFECHRDTFKDAFNEECVMLTTTNCRPFYCAHQQTSNIFDIATKEPKATTRVPSKPLASFKHIIQFYCSRKKVNGAP